MEICKKGKSAFIILNRINPKNLLTQYHKYYLIRTIEDYKYELNCKGNQLNLLKLTKEESAIRKLIITEVETYIQLWKYIESEYPEINRIKNLVKIIIQTELKVKETWHRIESCGIMKQSLHRIYSLYLELVHGDYIQSNHLHLITKEIERNNKNLNLDVLDLTSLNETNTPLIFLSAESKDMGNICRINATFSQIFGYIPSDIIGTSINSIISLIHKGHNDMYLLDIVEKQSDKTHMLDLFFMKHRNGYVVPTKMKIRIVNSLGENSQFLKIGRAHV